MTSVPSCRVLFFPGWIPGGRPLTGLLSLAEIYDLNLRADLVVLSACDTATGKRVAGEGADQPCARISCWRV